ncbi:hypothetical protein A3F07_04950 [candidate division WWE3 bacterium RIFCSPHIGHO2_12_FULL_38_15]|nr:MAG: hypothetical protein A2793_02540 [candidate division WWE3 bacterium RIFCSPHIGHO2_01_FULL_38_45]OGC48210.1 MAG: hypothetical protein A3F07_04950 [candidate division WWE3 bacterium RIFCSPHIGHO2_12_FULL_38_15]OGC52447.1 MAG: hypothetical protein A3B64_00095 [candidate division WWE3 bacterium RIFCSPLOWO2_01_FULL_37_24]
MKKAYLWTITNFVFVAAFLGIGVLSTKTTIFADEPPPIDIACIASTTRSYMDDVVDGAGALSNIRLLSPAFNMTSPHFSGMINGVSSGAYWDDLYGVAGNAYNTPSGTISGFVANMRGLIGTSKPIILTETGAFELHGADFNNPSVRGPALSRLREEFGKLPSQVEAAALFNAFNSNPDPDFQYAVMSNPEIGDVCSGLTDVSRCGVNSAVQLLSTPGGFYSRASGLGMGYTVHIATTNPDDPAGSARDEWNNDLRQAFENGLTPVIRIGYTNNATGFEDPQTYVDFLTELNDLVRADFPGKYIYAIAGPNEPESECWASLECTGCGGDSLVSGECELDRSGYMDDPKNRVIIKGTIKSEEKLTNSNGAMEGNKYANGVFVKAFAGSWLFGTGKEQSGQICDNTTCVNPSRVDGMCAISGRTRDYTGGDEFDCEMLEDDCDTLSGGVCNGKFVLQTYKSRHNFNNSNYLAFYCDGSMKMLLAVGLGGVKEIDPETGSPIINMNVSLDCGAENSPVEVTECVDYVARESYLLCKDPSGFDGGINAVGGDFESARGLKLLDHDSSYAGVKWQEFDKCPPGYTNDPPGSNNCKPPPDDPVNYFPQDNLQGSRVETELWEKLTIESQDIAAIPNAGDRLLAGNPWCDMVVPAPYSEQLDTAIPPCDNICKGNYPISDPNYSLSVNQRMCGGVSSNMFTPYDWEDQCNSMVTSPATTPVCCLDPYSDGTDCPADQTVYFDEIQPPTSEGLANKNNYRLPVECFPYSMCYTGGRLHSQNKIANHVINDVPDELVPPPEAQKQQPHSNSDEKPFQSVDIITTPVGSYETFGKFKNQINLSPVHGLVERSRAAVFSTPYRGFGVDFGPDGDPEPSEDARFPKRGRGTFVISANGPLPANCVYNFYDTGVAEVNNNYSRASDCEWCSGGEFISDQFPGEQSVAAEFKTKGVNTSIFDVLGWLGDFFANFFGLNVTNFDEKKASGPCTIPGGDSCTVSTTDACKDTDCGSYCEAQADDDPTNDVANPGDCCSYSNRQETYGSADIPVCGTVEYPIRIQFNIEGFNKNDESGYAGSQFYAQFRPPYENDFNVGQIYTYDCKAEKEKDPQNGACMGLDIGRGGPALGEYYMDKVGELMGDWSF